MMQSLGQGKRHCEGTGNDGREWRDRDAKETPGRDDARAWGNGGAE